MELNSSIRNIAIIAHLDRAKTTDVSPGRELLRAGLHLQHKTIAILARLAEHSRFDLSD
jgi:predicted membrane GTPase involved in stress response